MQLSVRSTLGEDGPNPCVQGVHLYYELVHGIWVTEYRSGRKESLEMAERRPRGLGLRVGRSDQDIVKVNEGELV